MPKQKIIQADKHACGRPGCQLRIPKALFACRRDWAKLPADVRRRINRGWAQLRAGGDQTCYRQAVREAFAAWRLRGS